MTAQPIIVQADALRLPLPDRSVDAIVTDPPYGLEFMGKDWDKLDGGLPQENVWKGRHGQGGASVGNDDTRPGSRHHVAYGGKPSGFRRCQLCGRRQFSGSPCTCPEPEWVIEYAQRAPSSAIRMQRWHETWAREAYRVLKPGGWLLAFGGTRTWHRLACGIEDAGFEMRDTIAEFGPLAWLYGSGFPKSLDVSKAIDKMAGAEREVIGRKTYPDGKPVRVADPSSKAEGWRRPWMDAEGTTGNAYETAPATLEAERWQGWGTALKPAWEPILCARKPLAGTVAQNALTFGTGALNIDASRIGATSEDRELQSRRSGASTKGMFPGYGSFDGEWMAPSGRWPPNVALIHSPGCQPTGTRKIRGGNDPRRRDGTVNHGGVIYGKGLSGGTVLPSDFGGYADADGMEEVTAWTCQPDCPVALLDQQSGELTSGANPTRRSSDKFRNAYGDFTGQRDCTPARGVDSGGASRFFYTAKAGPNERVTIDGEGHPTVKPLALMRWLVRLVTPPGGLVLDMFAGSGTTGEAAMLEGFRCVLIDKDPANLPSIRVRTHPYVRRTKVVTNGQAGPEQGSLL